MRVRKQYVEEFKMGGIPTATGMVPGEELPQQIIDVLLVVKVKGIIVVYENDVAILYTESIDMEV